MGNQINFIAKTRQKRTMGLFKSRGKHAQGAKKNAQLESVAAPEAVAPKAVIELPSVEESVSMPPETFASGEFGEIPKKKRRRALKVLGVMLGAVAAIAVIVYFTGVVVFMGRFMPNTAIGDNNISLKTDAEVIGLLDSVAADYQLNVIGGGFSYHTTGKKIGMSIDSEQIVRDMHADLNSWEWPLLVLQQGKDETGRLVVSASEAAYRADLYEALDKFNASGKDPVDATIVYDGKTEKFVVKPEEAGTKFDKEAVLSLVSQAIQSLDSKVALGEEQLIQPKAFSTDEKLVEAAELASGMVSAQITLVMAGQTVGQVNGETLSQFIAVDDKFGVTFKEDEMTAWVGELAEGFNTVGKERAYTRADGKEVSVKGGVYGWEIDADALKDAVIEGVKTGAAAQIEVPCYGTAEAWNGAGKRDWGNRYIDVDISEQYVRFYGDSGTIIWEADCISGTPDGKHDTVKGVWTVNAKESPSKLIGYENGKKIYETKVKYWMPFEGNGIGFHDATWQPSFGGTMYANGYGSHGCVNLSYDDARSLYEIIREGDVVVVHG